MSFVRIAPEQFDTLPDIPEPSENPVLVGHEDAADFLAASYRAGKMHHALLLAGPVGVGKATLAFHLANHLIAHPRSGEAPARLSPPDPASQAFRQIAQGAHPAVLHLTRPVNERTKGFKSVVTVDEIRRVSRFLGMTSHDGGYRIVIVDPADDMNVNAANALLKNLEEPPTRCLFILVAHQLGRLLPTIRSRCQLVKLKPLPADQLSSVLDRLGADTGRDDVSRRLILDRAGGSVREAILMTQYGGLEIAEALDAVTIAAGFEVDRAWRIAEAVAGRDSEIQFRIFTSLVLDHAANSAAREAGQGALGRSAALSELWSQLRGLIAEADAYNLDRKQLAMDLMRRLHAALHQNVAAPAGRAG